MTVYHDEAIAKCTIAAKVMRLQDDGTVRTDYDSSGSAALLVYALRMCKVRHAVRYLTYEETLALKAERANVDLGSGI